MSTVRSFCLNSTTVLYVMGCSCANSVTQDDAQAVSKLHAEITARIISDDHGNVLGLRVEAPSRCALHKVHDKIVEHLTRNARLVTA